MTGKMVNVTIQVPTAELAMLRETLRLSRHREKDPAAFIEKTALTGAVALASSTVTVDRWVRLRQFARKLGVESPV